MNKKANIYDVAKLAGVSHQTVSRVLNNHSSLKPATREKVEKAITELSYRPSNAARQLVTSQSRLIGVLIAEADLYGPASILNAMEKVARLEGYSLISIAVSAGSRESWREAIDQLRNLDIDGVITIALPEQIVKEIENSLDGAVIVIVDSEPSKKFDVVNMDNIYGATLATQYLIDAGHTEILHVTGPENGYEADKRKVGYETTMKNAKLKPEVIVGDWSIAKGFEAGVKVSKMKKRPTAVFCANDHLALGMIKAFNEAGIDVPGDISIIGFDNIPESSYLIPALTTVGQNFDELGNKAISRMLQQLIQESKKEAVMIKPALVLRSSTREIKSGKRIKR
ncbi:PurR Transcriptional regulators [Candidatus Nanopelagicaceae bacterium]